MTVKNVIFVSLFVALAVSAITLAILGINRLQSKDTVKVETTVKKGDSSNVVMPRVKVVFILISENIDYTKMQIDEIVRIIEQDSILKVEARSPEISIPVQIVKVYRVEDITCTYLKKRFANNDPGELVYEYNGKALVKLKDGVIKVYHEHLSTEK